MSRTTLRSSLVGLLAAALLVGPVSPVLAQTPTGTQPKHDQQVENTMRSLIQEAQRLHGRVDVAALTATVKQYTGKNAWERGVAFQVTDTFSSAFGTFSFATAPDGTVGIATRSAQGGCTMTTFKGGKVTTWTIGDVGKNCTGSSAIQGQSAGIQFADPIAPAAPTSLKVERGDSSAKLSWSAPADTDLKSYLIVQNGAVAATVPATTTTHTVTGLQNDTPYTFAVRVVDQAENVSLQSNEASATPTDLTAPAQVTGLKATVGDGALGLTWAASPAADLASYRVYRDGELLATVPAGSTTLNVGGLTNYTSYTFEVTAVDGHGNESVRSASTAAAPVDLTAPDAPSGVTVQAQDSALAIEWGAVQADDLAGYQVYVNGALKGVASAGKASFTVTELTNYTSYDIAVRAVDVNGNLSTSSATVSATPVDLTPPGVPSNVQAAAGDSSATISWTAATGGDVVSYIVYVNGEKAATVAAAELDHVLTGLTNYTEYSVTISALDEHGNESARSAAASVKPVDLTAPAVPAQLAAKAGDSQVSLTWAASADEDLAGYRIHRDGVLVATVTATSATIAGLSNYTAYSFTVSAYDLHDNESARAEAVEATPVDLTPPAVPVGVAVEALDSSLAVEWDAVTSDDLAGYNVHVNGAVVKNVPAGTTSLTVGGLENYTPYMVEVSALDVNGNESDRSAQVTRTPVDLTAPEQVTELVVVAEDSALSITWAPSDAADLGGYRLSVNGEVVKSLDVLTTSHRLEGLTNYTSYEISVVAVDVNKNESVPAVAYGAPIDLTAPAQVTGLAATAGDGALNLEWDASEAADLAGYRVYLGSELLATLNATERTHTVLGLENYTAYELSVVAFDEHQNASVPAVVTGIPVDLTAPAEVTGLVVTAGDSSLTAQWAASEAADLDGYRILLDGTEVAELGTSNTSHRIGGLENGTEYTISVVAVDVNENTSDAVTATGIPVDLTAPAQVAGLSANALDSKVVLTWTASDEAGVEYAVYQDGTKVATVTGTDHTVTGLQNGTEYTFTVSALDAAGNESDKSAAVRAAPVDLTAPAVPQNLAATAGDGTVGLTWTAVTDSDLAGYRVYNGTQLVASPASNSVTITGLTNGTAATFTVLAVDKTGNVSDPSTPVTATPKSAGVLAFDSFNRGTATTLGTTSDGKQAWQILAGTWGITNNVAHAITVDGPSTNRNGLAVLETGSPDQDVTVTTTQNDGRNIALRVADASNYLRISLQGFGTSVRVDRVRNGTVSLIGTMNVGGDLLSSTMHASIVGDTLTLSVGNFDMAKFTNAALSAAPYGTATRAGLYSGVVGTSLTYDDVTVAASSLAAPTAVLAHQDNTAAGAINLSWGAMNANITSYQVLRDGILLAELAGNVYRYTDPTPPSNVQALYQIVATDVNGRSTVGLPVAAAQYRAQSPTSVTDNFNRVNSTLGLGTTSDGKQVWQPILGVYGVRNSVADKITGDRWTGSITNRRPVMAVLDAGSPDMDVAATIGSNSVCMALRVADAKNYIRTCVGYGNSVQVYQVANGTLTLLKSIPAAGASTFQMPAHAQLVGDTMFLTAGDTSLGSFTDPRLSAGVLGSATRAGMWSELSSDFDNITVAGASVANPTGVIPDWAPGDGKIDLEWKPMNSTIVSYKVLRNGQQVGTTLPGTATSYTDTTAPAGVQHLYQVVAVDVNGKETAGSPIAAAHYIALGPTTVTDTFNRPDTTVGLGMTTTGGQVWQSLLGTWNIGGQQARVVATGRATNSNLAVVDAGSATQEVTAALQQTASIALRVKDSRNFIQVSVATSSGTTTAATVFHYVDGVRTTLATSTVTGTNIPGATTVSVTGTTVTVKRGTVTFSTMEIPELATSATAAATRAGVHTVPFGTNPRATGFDTVTIIGR